MIIFAIVARKCNPQHLPCRRWPSSSRKPNRLTLADPTVYPVRRQTTGQSTMSSQQSANSLRTTPFRLLLAAGALLCLGLACCQKAQPHRVTLTWEAPPAAPGVSVVGYNVYRSTTSGGQFVKLASRVPGPPYEDHLVVSGRTYFYVVTALDQNGRESRYSSQIRAPIP